VRKAHRIVLVMTVAALCALLLFPPWNYTLSLQGAAANRWPAPRAFLFTPPPRQGMLGVRLALDRLIIESLVVALIGATVTALIPRQRGASKDG
jgi:hypothetical protein